MALRRLVVLAASMFALTGCVSLGPIESTAPTAASTNAIPPRASQPTPAASSPAQTPEPVACPVVDPAASPVATVADPIVRPAVEGALAFFDEAPVVAIGEFHGWVAQHDFFAALVCDPGFPRVVDDVVIEWANRRLQPALDRYVAGEVVTTRALQSLWRESTQRSGVFDSPVYARFLGLIRTVNAGLPAADRVRVLAGDPPIHWSKVDKFGECDSDDPTCLDYWLFRRDESFAEVVIEEVLGQGRTALLIAGAGHLTRTPDRGERPPSVPDIVEASHPGSTRVILPHRHDGGAIDESLEDRIRDWPIPSLGLLDGTWLGQLDGCLLDDDRGSGPDATSTCPDGAGPTFADLADGYLYVGPG